MKSVLEIEKELEQAKKDELLKYREKELKELKEGYEGKCFGSHTFERNNAASNMGAVYYEKFYLKEGEIFVLEKTISLSKYNNYYKPSKTDISFNRHHYERKLTGNKYSASHNLYSGYSFYRKEISLEKFNQLWQSGDDCNIIIKEVFNSKAPELKQELIRQGDSRDESVIECAIKDMKLDMIDFKNYPNVHQNIEYCTLPMFQERRWLPKIFAKQVLNWQIEKWKEEQRDSWCTTRAYNYLQHKIDNINNFIIKEL